MTPAEELAQAADKLDTRTNGACPCLRCRIDRALAEWLRREAGHARELSRMLPAFDGAASPSLTVARLINGSAS